jgi:dihydrolipoamide dehydrogenase
MVAGELPRSIDVLVLGGGPGGYTAAARAAELGKEVVLVESQRLGGTCLNVGCIPSKALIGLAHDVRVIERRATTGLVGSASVDLAASRAWTIGVLDELRDGVASMLARVEVVHGTGRLLASRRVAVEADDHVSHFQYRDLIIATGSRPVTLAALPVDGVRVLDSSGLLALESIPATLAVVGGGYIGMELGMAFAQLGCQVTIVEALPAVLAGFDSRLVQPVVDRAAQLGMRLLTSTSAVGATADGLAVEGPDGAQEVPAECIVVAVGRRPNTDDLQLADVGLTTSATGHITVDQAGRTAVSGVWAIGDVTPGPALAHRASMQGRVVAEAITGRPVAFDAVVPLIAFTDPEVASVGLTAVAAREAGMTVVEGRARMEHNGRALTKQEPHGSAIVVVDADTATIVGVHLVGPDSSELIAVATTWVEMAACLDDVVNIVHAHPTLSEVLFDAAVAAQRRLDRKAAR